MEHEAGAIIEKVVRRSGVSIAELARRINVDRRSIYYWFRQSSLNMDTIYKIGRAINHDFSADFPNLIKGSFAAASKLPSSKRDEPDEDVQYWKHKYIALLERYNELLVHLNSVETEKTL